MKCLLVTNDFPPIISGISTQLYQTWRLLPPYDVAVLAPKYSGASEFDAAQPFPIFREEIPLAAGRTAQIRKTVANCSHAARLWKKHHFEKLHCGQIASTGFAGLACKLRHGIPFSVWVYGSETARFGFAKPLLRRICMAADEVIANSEFTLEEYVRLGVPRERLVKITPGVDTNVFTPRPLRADLVARFKPSGERILLTVARLDERKGHDIVIKALPQIAAIVPNVKYLIAGTGTEEQKLRQLVKDLRLEGSVIFLGRVPDEDLPHLYNLCDVFVLPNRVTEGARLRGDYEGFGIVFLEAAACAKPAIGASSGGVAEAIENGKSGLLVDPNSIDAFAYAAIRLLNEQDFARQLGEYARCRAVERFDWSIAAARLAPLLSPSRK